MNIPEHRWPEPWAPLSDEREALAFGRSIYPEVAGSVLAELHREMAPHHPLRPLRLRPLGWETRSKRDFLFLVDSIPSSFVSVHFTWVVEHDPRWPWFRPFPAFEEFCRAERKLRALPWELWKWL